ncbi:MAG: hypothetical protein MUO63_19125 [Desulfobulbaceae bacterium]|nr:hypothetical protein [Desulfobulbaceae bacterium]
MGRLPEFRKDVTETVADRGVRVHTWASGGRRSPNLLEITTAPKTTVLYVKEFNVLNKPGFWGLTKNQIERLDTAAARWLAVLLLRSSVAGYVLTDSQVAKCIADGSFELSGDGDFKVNESQDLQTAEAFKSIEELLGRIL